VVNFTHQPFYPLRKHPWYILYRRWAPITVWTLKRREISVALGLESNLDSSFM
jgi:hypothetical protein